MLLNQEKFDEITANSDSDLFDKISPLLVAKQRTRSLTLDRYSVNYSVMITDREEFFRAERYHLEHGYLACMLYHLQEATILTQNNFKLILEHTALYNLAYLSDVLFKANLLTEANFAMVANHQHPDDLCELFDKLSCYKYKYTTLTQEDLQCIVEHTDLKDVISKVESLHSMHQLTKDNLRLVIGQQNKLIITSADEKINANLIDHFLNESYKSCLVEILIMTSNQAAYDRICALLPKDFRVTYCGSKIKTQPLALVSEQYGRPEWPIKNIYVQIKPFDLSQQIQTSQRNKFIKKVLFSFSLDIFGFRRVALGFIPLGLICEYIGLNEVINLMINPVALPFDTKELPEYEKALHRELITYQETIALNILQNKLCKLIVSIEEALTKAQLKSSVFKSCLSKEKAYQVKTIRHFINWLSDDRQTLTSEQKQLLGAHRAVRVILANSSLQLAKLAALTDEFRHYDEERARIPSLKSLWANRHISPGLQTAFDNQYGIVPR